MPEEKRITHHRDRQLAFWGLVALLLIAAGLRAGFVLKDGAFGSLPTESHSEYFRAGKRLALHGAFLSAWPASDDVQIPSAMLPPVYTAVVAGAFNWANGNEPRAAQVLVIFNIVCSVALVPVCFFAGRELRSQRVGWIAAFIAATHPLLIAYNGLIWDTALFALLVGGCVWACAVLAQRKVTLGRYFSYGCLLGLTALVNPALTLFYPMLVLWPVLKNSTAQASLGKSVTRAVVASSLGFAMLLSPWVVRNYQVFERVIYVRDGLWMQVWLGAVPGTEHLRDAVWTEHYPLNNGAFDNIASKDWATAEQVFIDRCQREAIDAIAENPKRWLSLCADRACDYWFGTTLTHGSGRFALGGPTRWALMGYLTIETGLLIFVLLGLLCRRSSMWWWALGCLIFSLVYCGTIVMLRFRAPMEPLAAIVMAAAVESLMRRAEKRQRGPVT